MKKIIVSILMVLAIIISSASTVVAGSVTGAVNYVSGDTAGSDVITIANAAGANTAGAANSLLFDTTKLENGIITISCKTDSAKKLKVMVEKGGKKVTYDLRNDGTKENFPLQFGDGEYKVSVLENTEGNKYRYIAIKNISLDMDDDKKVYLESVQNIKWNRDMSAIKKATELTKGLKTDSEKIKSIYDFVISNISYDKDKLSKLSSNYVPDIENTLVTGKGICYDYSSLLAAMLRSQGIPTKLVKGYSTYVKGYHAWNEIYDSSTGKWITVDATYDAEMKAAGRNFSMAKDAKNYTKVYEY